MDTVLTHGKFIMGPEVGELEAKLGEFSGVGIVVSSGTATIRIEVFTEAGVPVNGAIVAVSTTLGTLGADSLTTVNGVITTSLTAPDTAGTAYITATVENATATTTVPILAF